MNEQELKILEGMFSRIEQCEKTESFLMNTSKELVRSNRALTESLDILRYEYERYSENCIYEILDPRVKKQEFFYPKIKTVSETMYELINSEKSMCRFGDGEFACISGNLRAQFTTRYYTGLADRLKEVLASNNDDIMIAIADNYGDLSSYSCQSRREIRSYMTQDIRKQHEALLDINREYYNAYITRPSMFCNNDSKLLEKYMESFKLLWKGKKAVIIEGSNTGFGALNDLLDTCSDIRRVIAPSKDAFEKYNDIINAVLKEDENSLYLIALGPVATVLAYDLAKRGRRAIDIGHLDIEYEWMKRGEYRTAIPYKYVNEVVGGTEPEAIDDALYKEQIVIKID